MGKRGATPAVARILGATDRHTATEVVACLACGEPIDFTRRDPLGLGRSMQGCTNVHCADHPTRPLPRRAP